MLEKLLHQINVIFGVGAGILSYCFGTWDGLLQAILIFVIMDYITGILKSIMLHNLSSEIGFKGLAKKIIIFIIIAVANILQILLDNAIPLRETVIMFYIINEAVSILENASYFIPIPKKLKEILKQLKEENNVKFN